MSVASTLVRARRLNNRTIPWAFTDLVAAAVQCLPSCTRPKGALALRDAVAKADAAGAAHWPDAARELFERCRAIAADQVPVLPAGLIGPALDVAWPDPRGVFDGREFHARHAWTRRRDIGTADPEEDQ